MAAEEDRPIVFPAEVRERLLRAIYERLPVKSFGYLISEGDSRQVDDFVLFEGNSRNSAEWQSTFQAYGQYFVDHDDAGFVSTPEETWRVQKEMWRRGMTEVGMFHSHLRHPANFSGIDYDMHISRYQHLWHMIVAVRNRAMPQVRIFDVRTDSVREQVIAGESAALPAAAAASGDELFALDAEGRPDWRLAREIVEAFEGGVAGAAGERLLAGSAARYEQYVKPRMREVAGGRFAMGMAEERRRHFVGESPAREVEVRRFLLSEVTVTNELMGLLDPLRLDDVVGLNKPAVDVSWYEAKLFALWMGCRLLGEAEWEYACGAGAAGEWACPEAELPGMAWYSENSHGEVQEVGRLKPNVLGLHDLHGNVWEWCEDRYGQDAYAGGPAGSDRVCRGGSVHALSEMCRTRYRLHEPAEFRAGDLGFRLARGGGAW